MGAATLVLVGALVGATNAGQSDPSVENLQRSASTLLGHAQDAITAVMPKQTPTPTPKPTRTIAGHLKVISSGYLQLEYVDEKARFLADYQPQLFAAGPLRGKPMTGTLSLPAWGYCDCFANSQRRVGRGQVKVKIAATSTASKTQTLRLGGTSSILSGAYLVIVTDTKPTYFPPSGLKLRAVSYRIPAAAAIKQAQWVTFVPANPSGYNESARAGSGGSTVPTHWTTMKLAPGKSMADKRVNQSVLVFDLPGLDSPSYWHVSVVWVTDQGVLAGWIDHSHERAVSKF